MIFIKNRYYDIYCKIVQRGLQQFYKPTELKEKHHIIPESFFISRSRTGPQGWLLGDPEDTKNIVYLTPREHAFCHKLLVKITEGKMKSKMQLAIWRMMHGKSKIFFSSREYQNSRILFKQNIKSSLIGKKKPPMTEVHKLKLSKASKGITKPEKTKENMRNAWKLRSRTVKESTKELNSIASKAFWSLEKSRKEQSNKRKQFLNDNPEELKKMVKNLNQSYKCEHCGLVSNVGNYKRWHGSKCKLNKLL